MESEQIMETNEVVSIKNESIFFYIPLSRLVFMGILTLGIFDAYWIYKNWNYINKRDNLGIQPFWRGFFCIFYCHSLFKYIKDDSEANTIKKAHFSTSGLATGWVIINILGNLVSRMNDVEVRNIGLIISFPSFLFFIPVQNYINSANEAIEPRPKYNEWTIGHFVCLAIGIVIWAVIFYNYSIK